jgi:transcriptional regulator with XRE-family HTH domain
MSEGGLNATDIVKATGLTHSLISRVLSGKNEITRDRLLTLLRFWIREPTKAARLQAAHLLDQLSGPGAKLVSVRVWTSEIEHHVVD